MEEKNFKEIWKNYWKNSNFWMSLIKLITSVVVGLSIALWKSLVILFRLVCKILRKFRDIIKSHPIPSLSITLAISLMLNIYLFVEYEATEHSISDTVWNARKNMDTEKAIEYHKGYSDATLEYKNTEKLVEIETEKVYSKKKHKKLKLAENNDSTSKGGD